jgi:HEPN domain-containing protein
LTRQLKGSHPKHHDLLQLVRSLGSLIKVDENALQSMPSSKRIIEMRAGEGRPIKARRAYEIYRASMALTSQLTAALRKKFRMRNAAFLIKKAPFI